MGLWTVSITDIFKISDDGVLTFDKSPNFEGAKRTKTRSGDLLVDQGKGDNVYQGEGNGQQRWKAAPSRLP